MRVVMDHKKWMISLLFSEKDWLLFIWPLHLLYESPENCNEIRFRILKYYITMLSFSIPFPLLTHLRCYAFEDHK